MDSIRYLKPSEEWCSMELKLHYSYSPEKRRPGFQTMFTCRHSRKLNLKHINKAIFTCWHDTAVNFLNCCHWCRKLFYAWEKTTSLYTVSYFIYCSCVIVSECGEFLAWLEHARTKATLKINSLWLFSPYFSAVKSALKQKIPMCI